MSDTILFDKLAYIDRLKRAGIDENQARAHAEAMNDALRESVATKADLRTESSRLQTKIEAEVTRLENKIEAETTRLENKIVSEVTRLENKIGSESARLETKIDLGLRDVTIRIGAMLVALFAALAAIKFFG
jgi:predicted nuclease with TOPRIM domain